MPAPRPEGVGSARSRACSRLETGDLKSSLPTEGCIYDLTSLKGLLPREVGCIYQYDCKYEN